MKKNLLALVACCAAAGAQADAVTEWNVRAAELIQGSGTGTPHANRIMAIAQTAVYEAVNGVTGRYPASALAIAPAPGASVEAAIAGANCAVFRQTIPAHVAAIDKACAAALAAIPEGEARAAGVALGERAAAAVLASRADDQPARVVPYKPSALPGVYVPTTMPIILQWPQRKPWMLSSPSQLRPGPPPALTSGTWIQDYNEVRALGARDGSTRDAEQTAIAKFWEGTLPSVYHGVARSVADQPGRELTRNARLFMALTQGMDDALIAVFDAKYAYNFWRPVTAIRNGDTDGSNATVGDPTWTPLIETPMHPEYPCAHCILSATVATVIAADVGTDPMPRLSTSSDVVKATRSWATPEELVREVALARIYDGVHYRNSTEVGGAMGRQVGAIAAARHFNPP